MEEGCAWAGGRAQGPARAMGKQCRVGVHFCSLQGVWSLSSVCPVPESDGTPDPCDHYMSTFSGLESPVI